MIYLPKSVRVESDGISGAGAFVGNLLLEGFYAIERRSTLATVLLALMDCFEVAGIKTPERKCRNLHRNSFRKRARRERSISS